MNRTALQVAWYRFRGTFGRQWSGYLTLVVLIGVVGGLSLGAIAGARRTLASPQVYYASVDPPTFGAGTGILDPALGYTSGYDAGLVARISRLPHVTRVATITGLNLVVMRKDGSPVPLDANPGNGSGSVGGIYFSFDRVSVVAGRRADPADPHEVMMNSLAAQFLGLHLGEVVPFGIYSDRQTEEPGFGTRAVPPLRRIEAKLVGIVVDPTTVAADDVDSMTTLQIFTPALTEQLLSCCVNYSITGIAIERSGDAHAVSTAQHEVQALIPKGLPVILPPPTSSGLARALRAVKPLAVALAVFGGIAGLVALVVAGQVLGRQLRLDAEERSVIRALGGDPWATAGDGVLGLVLSILLGSVVALGVAVALSPLAPIGVIRSVYPHRGVAWDSSVLIGGFMVLVVGLGSWTLVVAYRQRPSRPQPRWGRSEVGAATVAARWGLPSPAVEGVRFALDPGTGRRSVPVRSTIFGAVLAMIVVVATVTFGASLNSLVSHPGLYGWNWDYALAAGGGSGDIPASLSARLLDHDPSVASWSGAYVTVMDIDGQQVATMGQSPGAAVAPPVLTGHGLDGTNQIVVGASTLATLGRKVGESVVVDNGLARVRLLIVGTASLPTLAGAGGPHPEMGSGAIVSSRLVSAAGRNPFADPVTGPEDILVRLKSGVDGTEARRSLQHIAALTSNPANFGVGVTGVLRPAEIVNYRSMGTTPVLLGATLALGAVAALGLTLIATVRRRRRQLAIFKALGFTRRQLYSTVSWQASVSVVIGLLIGVPLGVVAGRLLWILFATQIHAVPVPVVPVGWVIAIAVGALVLANLVAAVPGRSAARTPTALVLRAD